MHSPYSDYLCRAPVIAAVVTNFTVFSYDAVSDRDSNQSPPRRRTDALRVEQWLWVTHHNKGDAKLTRIVISLNP